jgi:hypothetical protein
MLTRLYLLILLLSCTNIAISQQKANPAMPCYQALSSEPQFATIREKVSLGGVMDEMRRMTKSSDRANQQEASALATWRDAREKCHQQEVFYFATRDSKIEALARDHFAAVQTLITDLQAGNLTYGEFSKRRIEVYESASDRIEKVRQAVIPPTLPPRPLGK